MKIFIPLKILISYFHLSFFFSGGGAGLFFWGVRLAFPKRQSVEPCVLPFLLFGYIHRFNFVFVCFR